jgi:AcrR family transcriptional regulator
MARPKEAILSRNLIRDQALSIIDEEGMDGLTMRRLAMRLGVQAASLYTHFPNKEAVLDAIAERLAKRIDPTGFADSWQEGLSTWANSYYTAIHWHPNAAAVFATASRARTAALTRANEVHAGLLSHGWPARQASMVAAATGFLVLGAAMTTSEEDPAQTSAWPARSVAARGGAGSPLDHFAETLDRASFTMALDSLITGLESVHAGVSGRQAAAKPNR